MKRAISVSLLFFAFAMSCAGRDTLTLGNRDYGLSANEISILSEDAYGGSGEAALRLSDRYFHDLSRGKRREMLALSLSWALIGAENGSKDAQFRAYQLLSMSDKRVDQIRALFWLKQAAKNGNEDAQLNLADCPTIDAKRHDGESTPCFGSKSW